MTDRPHVLVTGGAGYIGSHTYIALVEAGYRPVILDDFSNSDPVVLERLQHITGQPVVCERGSVADTARVQALLAQHAIQAVVHFAAFKAVGESVAQPVKTSRARAVPVVFKRRLIWQPGDFGQAGPVPT